MLNIDALLTPISDALPAGNEARASDEYEAVANEIEKLTSISSTAPIDWALVEQQGSELLAKQSKDFMLAAWLSAAWVDRHGVNGLVAGLALHAYYIEHYWDTGFPPLKRIRGRRNALSWWIERCTEWLNSQTLEPLEPDTWMALVENAEKIDRSLAELDPEAPTLMGFVRQLKALDQIELAAEPVVADEPTVSPDVAAAAAATDQHTEAPITAVPATPVVATIAAQKSVIIPPVLPVTAGTDLTSLDDIISALGPVNHALGQLSNALMALDRFNPLAIEMNRFAARSTLLQHPPAQDQTTALMAPPVAIMDAFQIVCGTANAEGMIEFCESRLPAFPFWLDLDYQSARGFAMLEERGAVMRQTIINNALAFIERLPGIELLHFSDGTPFASAETQQWLAECRAQQSGPSSDDSVQSAFECAKKTLHAGKTNEALAIYHELARQTSTRRVQFLARIGMADALISTRADVDPLPYVRALADDCQHYQLADWEPELAAQAWQTVLDACRQAMALPALRDDSAKRNRYQELHDLAIQQLSIVDFPAAIRYSA